MKNLISKTLGSLFVVITSSVILIILIIVMGLLFGPGLPEKIIDSIIISQKKAINTNLSIHYDGKDNKDNNKDAMVSRSFEDEIQACWYYHANYKNSHPYTLLWEKSEKGEEHPKIRIIADPAYWYAHSCIIKEGKVRLIGTEYTKHSIEAQLSENKDFIRIAESNAYYQSELIFDQKGRPTERKVLESDFKCVVKDNFDCKTERFYSIKEKKFESKDEERIKMEGQIRDLKNENTPFNKLEIIITKNAKEGFIRNKVPVPRRKPRGIKSAPQAVGFQPDFAPRDEGLNPAEIKAIKLYIREREKLHRNLAEEGCGVISIEPNPKKEAKTDSLVKPSIAFLCFKESGSHVRLMQRE